MTGFFIRLSIFWWPSFLKIRVVMICRDSGSEAEVTSWYKTNNAKFRLIVPSKENLPLLTIVKLPTMQGIIQYVRNEFISIYMSSGLPS